MVNMSVSSNDLVGSPAWSRVHRRVWDTPGTVLDIGCAGWQWSRQFFGRKHVVGYDPQETSTPEGVGEGVGLISMSVGPWPGTAVLYGRGIKASLDEQSGKRARETTVAAIGSILVGLAPLAVVKLNVEGGEYVLLPEMKHPVADQLVVSFHDWAPGTEWRKDWTEAMIRTLGKWYEPIQLQERWNWWLFVSRTQKRTET